MKWTTQLTVGALSAVLASACAHHIVLRRPPERDTGAMGVFQRCLAGQARCEDDEIYDGSRLSQSNTTFFSLPDCPFGIKELLIEGAGGSNPLVIARCAAPSPVPTECFSTPLPTTTLDHRSF